jgi:hypothetical protein
MRASTIDAQGSEETGSRGGGRSRGSATPRGKCAHVVPHLPISAEATADAAAAAKASGAGGGWGRESDVGGRDRHRSCWGRARGPTRKLGAQAKAQAAEVAKTAEMEAFKAQKAKDPGPAVLLGCLWRPG